MQERSFLSGNCPYIALIKACAVIWLNMVFCRVLTVQILCIGTDRSQQTVQTKIRLLMKKQSDQGLCCLPFQQHLVAALMQCYIKLFHF